MSFQTNAQIQCRIIGNFVEEAAPPTQPVSRGEVVQPSKFLSHVETNQLEQRLREFKVILRDRRMVSVRGSELSFVPSGSTSAEAGSYAILRRTSQGDQTVAFFPCDEVTGIFHGELLPA